MKIRRLRHPEKASKGTTIEALLDAEINTSTTCELFQPRACMEHDSSRKRIYLIMYSFNPRVCMRRDWHIIYLIHMCPLFQSTRSRGTRRVLALPTCFYLRFNPRARTERMCTGFNPRTRAECDFPRASDTSPTKSFNPRTRAECDVDLLSVFYALLQFQSTHSCGVRQEEAP